MATGLSLADAEALNNSSPALQNQQVGTKLKNALEDRWDDLRFPATGKTLSDMLIMKLSRVGGDGLDTYGADARLLEFDIHYLVDDKGSEDEFSKTRN